ncbi:hypothetical protein POM88_048298 [Heracleum sosnowskyi]|uniref:NB-ARC domain-containing protein n=1 Tax=Heracleum sosnowskyi TaxID=360622 RepID=A0AAD8GTL7_9APIA|nr:hypothetical protein POM88_048298 [Heracleum sosnowskyi]
MRNLLARLCAQPNHQFPRVPFPDLPSSPPSYEHISSASKSRVDLLFDSWIDEVNMLLKYPYWLPIQRCQIIFYSENLRSSMQAFPSFTLTGDPKSPYLLLIYQKAYNAASGIDEYKIVKTNVDFENLNEPPDLNCVGDRLVLEVAEIYKACIQVFGKTNSPDPDFASHFYFDKKKFQEQLDKEVFVGFQEEASSLLKKLVSITKKQLEVISIVGMAGLGKTTLARRLYDDPYIVSYFYVRVWVNCSQDYRKRDLLLGILRSVVEIPHEVCRMNDNMLAHELYRALMGRRSGNPPESISQFTDLQALIMSSRVNMVVPKNLWKMIQLKHLCIKSGENLLSFSNVEEPSTLENLQTMSLVSPTRQCEHILARTRNLLKLGLCGSLTTKSGDLKIPDLGFLVHLETLKLLNTAPLFKAGRLSTSILFPETLKSLTISNTYLDWKEAWVFEMIPNLEVLKLRLHAFAGKDWETSPEAFQRLKILKFDELNIVTWTASRNHFPVLQRLQVYRCPYLMEIPEDFGNIFTLEWIELIGCSDAATESARDIQKEQESMGNDWPKILLNPGLSPT